MVKMLEVKQKASKSRADCRAGQTWDGEAEEVAEVEEKRREEEERGDEEDKSRGADLG